MNDLDFWEIRNETDVVKLKKWKTQFENEIKEFEKELSSVKPRRNHPESALLYYHRKKLTKYVQWIEKKLQQYA